MDQLSISAAAVSAKALYDILKCMASLKLDNETLVRINDAFQHVADMQHEMIAQNERFFAVQRERDELQRELVALSNWEQQKAAYTLKETNAGAFLWESIVESPKHYACSVCILDKKIVPLNKVGDYDLICPACKNLYKFEKHPPMQPLQRRSIRFGHGSW